MAVGNAPGSPQQIQLVAAAPDTVEELHLSPSIAAAASASQQSASPLHDSKQQSPRRHSEDEPERASSPVVDKPAAVLRSPVSALRSSAAAVPSYASPTQASRGKVVAFAADSKEEAKEEKTAPGAAAASAVASPGSTARKGAKPGSKQGSPASSPQLQSRGKLTREKSAPVTSLRASAAAAAAVASGDPDVVVDVKQQTEGDGTQLFCLLRLTVLFAN